MPGKSGISASELARNYGVSLNEFADEVIALLARLESDLPAARFAARRREVCAAVSAAMSFALDASTLTPEERARLDPLLREVLLPFWNKHCTADQDAAAYITERSGFYLSNRVAGSQVKTAVSIVTLLADALELSAERKTELIQKLSPAFAHRMVSDVYRLNDVRSKFGVQLSLLAALSAFMQMPLSYDVILRILRMH
jgi:hypothetical protein